MWRSLMQELKEAINIRYASEASCCSSLSCGGAYELAKVKEGEIFLDLGSGRGQDVLKAAKDVGRNGIAYGVDFTKEMVNVAENTRKKLKIENAKFFESEIENLPFSENVFDVIISNCTINHSKDKPKVFSEIYRVLKPKGRVIISDVLAVEKLPEEVVNDPVAWAGCYGGAIPQEEYFEAIAKAGFLNIEILEESTPYKKGDVMVKSLTIKIQK